LTFGVRMNSWCQFDEVCLFITFLFESQIHFRWIQDVMGGAFFSGMHINLCIPSLRDGGCCHARSPQKLWKCG
jgi:hypothetical protein